MLPRADALRRAQAAAVAAREASTLTDFDWQLQYVLSSSKLATVREPLLVLELRTRAAGAAADAPADAAETVELARRPRPRVGDAEGGRRRAARGAEKVAA